MHLRESTEQQHPRPLLVDRRAATDMLSIGASLLDELVRAGEVEVVRLNNRRLYSVASIERLARTGAQVAAVTE